MRVSQLVGTEHFILEDENGPPGSPQQDSRILVHHLVRSVINRMAVESDEWRRTKALPILKDYMSLLSSRHHNIENGYTDDLMRKNLSVVSELLLSASLLLRDGISAPNELRRTIEGTAVKSLLAIPPRDMILSRIEYP